MRLPTRTSPNCSAGSAPVLLTAAPDARRPEFWHAEIMVGSVAVLSAIHGVMPALDAVLAEPDLQRAGRIVLTGDIAAGPQPTQVLDRLLGLGDKVVWVRGNADRELVELARGEVVDVGDAIAPWAAKQPSDTQLMSNSLPSGSRMATA